MMIIKTSMPLRALRGGLSLIGLIAMGLVLGCGGDGGGEARKATSPAKGKVMVDGQPGNGVLVTFHSSDKKAKASSATADKDGNFQVSTYQSGDGLPPGEYTLTFEWQEVNPLRPGDNIPDKLKGKYKDPANSKHKVNIDKAGKDLGAFELSAK